MKRDLYQEVTDRIIAKLEAGVIPWRKEWSGTNASPRNLTTLKEYRGINTMLLRASAGTSPYWLTYRQAESLGAHVKKGSKGEQIVFFKFLERGETDPATGEQTSKRIPLLRCYTVFNLDQVEGLPEKVLALTQPKSKPDFVPVEACEKLVRETSVRPGIAHGGSRACYSPIADQINMPVRESFNKPEAYYATLFHEMGHATGHAKRLNREGLTRINAFGDHSYSQEELVAEMCASFLCAKTGIDAVTLDNSAAYIDHWLGVLRNERTLLVKAAGQAQKAADLVLGTTFAEEADQSE